MEHKGGSALKGLVKGLRGSSHPLVELPITICDYIASALGAPTVDTCLVSLNCVEASKLVSGLLLPNGPISTQYLGN